MKSKQSSTINGRLDLRLAAYAAAGAAVAATAALPSAGAALIDSGAVNINIPNSIDGVYFNLLTGVTGASGAAVPGWDFNPYNNGAGLTFYGAASPSGILASGTAGTSAVAQRLTGGETVGPASTFFNQFQTLGTLFQPGGVAYVGIRFLNETTSVQDYGWVQITSAAGSGTSVGFPAAITRYGYDDAGGSVVVPNAVPEPATTTALGVLAAGAVGLRSLRRRRSAS